MIDEPPVLGFQPGRRLVWAAITGMVPERQNDEGTTGVAGRNMERVLRPFWDTQRGGICVMHDQAFPGCFLAPLSSHPPSLCWGRVSHIRFERSGKGLTAGLIRAFSEPGVRHPFDAHLPLHFAFAFCSCSKLSPLPSRSPKRRHERNST